ncbi:MAG: DoxX family protein [Opitutales bacterium]
MQTTDLGKLIVRVGIGGFFIAHGIPKFLGGTEGLKGVGSAIQHIGLDVPALYIVFGLLAALSETVGGLLFALGLGFRTACVFLTGTMAVAAGMLAANGAPFMTKVAWPIEMAILFIGFALIGPGQYRVRIKARSA